MSKKAAPSLSRFRDEDVQTLHSLLKGVFCLDGGLKSAAEHARERCFAVRSNAKLFKYWYVRSQVSKRFQEGTTSAKCRHDTAIAAFRASEDVCRATNARCYDLFNRGSSLRFHKELVRARRIVAEILGGFRWEEFPYACAFSSGASTEFRRIDSAIQKKWAEAAHITQEALPYGLAFARWAGVKEAWQFVVVPGNEVFTVVKNHEKDRTCAKEPSWNMFFQKGVGKLLRKQLQRRVGLLHPDAQWKHMRLAQEASVHGQLATLDLSAASDTVALALVDSLVPPDWKDVLYALRSKTGVLPDGTQITYEKISSMGNGYTFELETLLFYALVKACCDEDELVSVYGDDIICPTRVARRVTSLLAYCGFTLNPEKSFTSGKFRESCGGHYFSGVDVKPFYIERLPTTYGQVINLHNDIVRYHVNMPPNQRLVDVARQCRRMIPRVFWGPMGLQGALWSEWDEARPSFSGKRCEPTVSKRPNYQHWRIKTVTRAVVTQRHDYYLGSYLATLWPPGHSERGQDRTRRPLTCREFALAHHASDVSQADFMYAMTREKISWQSVGVGSLWPKLPVRI